MPPKNQTSQSLRLTILGGGARGSSSQNTRTSFLGPMQSLAAPQPISFEFPAPAGNYFDAVKKFRAYFCFFCSDPCDRQNSLICIHCGAIICIATHIGGAGCIGARTLEVVPSAFECPICIGSSKTKTSILPYYLAGSGLRRTPKIAWPLLLHMIQLKNLESLVLEMVSLTMKSNYVLDTERLLSTHIDMRKGGEVSTARHVDQHIDFINKSMWEGCPCNLIIVLDTHSDTFSGQLQATGGLTGAGTFSSLPDLVDGYVGEGTLDAMRKASESARGYDIVHEISPGVTPWADITPKARGGWRVMVMVSCGSSVRAPMHWEYISQLFARNSLDLLVGFGGHETMPHDVQPFVDGLVEKISINGMGGDNPLWQVVSDCLTSYPTTVTTNTVIAAYKTGNGVFTAREIGMHRAERPLGQHFIKCGNPDCESRNRPGHIIGEIRETSVARIRCKACKWKSKYVKIDDNPFITRLHKTKAPMLFYHTFPSPAGLSSMFL